MKLSKKTAVRVIAWILALLMILSAGILIFQVFASAEETDFVQATESEDIGGEDFSANASANNTYDYSKYLTNIDECQTPVRVGIFYIYGSNNCLAFSHNISSENGLMFYSVKENDEYTFFCESDKPVTVLRDLSAAKNSSGKYYFTTENNTHIIYHCITSSPIEQSALDDTVTEFRKLLSDDIPVFPMYIGGETYIAVGTYGSREESANDCENLKSLLNYDFTDRIPNNTCISVIETDSGKILFKIDTADCRLFVRPIGDENQEKEYYIKSSVGNIFDGTFEYRTTAEGLYLVNILELDDYIKSVLPYEISSSWPDETLKAFSVVVRSYTLSNIYANHKNQDFDMCDETHCQAYRGRLRSTERTDAAVDSTKNIVLAYDSEICKAFYYAVAGGMTESSQNAWYARYEYLQPVELPFENYQNHTYGEWSTTVSKEEFFAFLESNTTIAKKITAPIKSVRISEYTPSGYAYKLEIIDENGTVAVFEKTDNIRTILSKYCKSARMSIGKIMQVSINEEDTELDAISFFQTDSAGKSIRFNAMSEGTEPVYKTVLTADGEFQLIPSTEMITISGTGWGHGVGMSQFCAKEMALIGYTWTEIATYFYPGAYLANLSDLSTPLFTEETDEPDEPIEENSKPPNEPDDDTETDSFSD